MLRSLYSGVSGMKAFQTKLDVIGNNIANVNTFGFKAGRVTFKDMVSQTIRGAAAPTSGGATPATNVTSTAAIGGINPQQVGLGATVGSIDTIDTQGSLQTTGRTLDLAIQGSGYFHVKSPDGKEYFTRAGNFYLSPNNDAVNGSAGSSTLVTATGEQVLDNTPSTSSGPKSITIPTGATNLSISPDGKVTYTDSAGAIQNAGTIGIVIFQNPGGLAKVGDNLYTTSNNSNNPSSGYSSLTSPGSSGAGTVQSGFLEMSNVDLANEMTEMIVAQRGFQANTKIITTSDQILQELANLKQ